MKVRTLNKTSGKSNELAYRTDALICNVGFLYSNW